MIDEGLLLVTEGGWCLATEEAWFLLTAGLFVTDEERSLLTASIEEEELLTTEGGWFDLANGVTCLVCLVSSKELTE